MMCRILLLIILTSCVSGSFVVNVTQSSYQAEENHNITLEWTFTTKPDHSLQYIFIHCVQIRSGKEHEIFSDKVLDHIHEGVEVSEFQDAKFSGRVQSDKDALREGRIRLHMCRLRTDDSGLYLCHVRTDYGSGSASCELMVTRSFVVNVTQTSYQAEENDSVTLEWTFTTKPDRSWNYIFIFCDQLTDHQVSVLYQVRNGVEVSESQDAKFSGRVQSDKDGLREGRIRLHLSRLRTDDSGLYRCKVNTDYGYGFAICRLSVIAIFGNPETQRPTLISPPESDDRPNQVGLRLGISATVLVAWAVLCFIFRNNKRRLNLMLNVSEARPIRANRKPSGGRTSYQGELVELQITT